MAEMPFPLCVEEQTRALPHLDRSLRTEAGFQMFERARSNGGAARQPSKEKCDDRHVLEELLADTLKITDYLVNMGNIGDIFKRQTFFEIWEVLLFTGKLQKSELRDGDLSTREIFPHLNDCFLLPGLLCTLALNLGYFFPWGSADHPTL